jgi:acetyltransferase
LEPENGRQMSVRNLDKLFRPASVAVIGASDRPHSIGAVAIRNLLAAGFRGPILPVNPKHPAIAGVLAYPDVAALPLTPDLAVICTPPAPIPGIIDALGRRGTKAAVVITAGLDKLQGPAGGDLQQAMLDAARPHLLRVLGPNCIGLLVPGLRLNASFAHTGALPGTIGFVSQSGALCTIVLDWAKSRGVGFSHFISLGNTADVDFGDVIDYLASDADTRAILLYVEAVKHARKFFSAARAAARNKPIIAIKGGRDAAGQRAARSHTGALAGGDEVYSAAFQRAGIVRVDDTEELFAATETLARIGKIGGERLGILTNGGGPGVLAVDALTAERGRLAEFAPATMAALDGALPGTWSRANPADIVGDATGERYAKALKILLADPGIDALLVMHAPTAVVSPMEPAQALIAARDDSAKKLLACWMGGEAVAPARQALSAAGIATYDTPHAAVRAFSHLVEYRRTQDMLMETPPAAPTSFAPDVPAARAVIGQVLREGRSLLTEPEAKAVLKAYGVPVVATVVAPHAAAAAAAAARLGYPVALKILSPDVTHKTDVGGVALDLNDAAALTRAAGDMLARVKRLQPAARIDGFSVQTMARRPRAHELIVGAASDPIFGPVILFGHGGTAVEVVGDRAIALPPLNLGLARALIEQTRIAKLLAGYRDRPAADRGAIAEVLVRLSQLIADLPEVAELDINPLFADAAGVLALDARMRVQAAASAGSARLAIRPYPQHLEETVVLADGTRLLLRPIRPEDEPQHLAFFNRLSPEDVRFRFFGMVRSLPHTELARYTQIDYDREMAFIAVPADAGKPPETLGVVRAVGDPDNEQAEFAIIVRSDLKGRGLGWALMQKIVAYCRERGTGRIIGQILSENQGMRKLAEEFGFTSRRVPGGDIVEVTLNLRPASQSRSAAS